MANTKCETVMMSMYSEFLALSLIVADDAMSLNERGLLKEVADCRDRLQLDQTHATGHRKDASSRVATELQYDGALIRLCRLHAIPCDPLRFTRPLAERKRLEEALEAVGVAVRAQR